MGKKKAKRSSDVSVSKESTPQASDSDTEVEIKKKPKTTKGPKSSAELCKEYNLEDVDLEYTEADYQNLTTFSLFSRMVRPQIIANNSQGCNPKLSNSKMSALLEAKWREFQNSNPLKQSKEKQKKPKSETEQSEDSDSGESSGPTQTKRRGSLKIRLPITISSNKKKKKEVKPISSDESDAQSDKSIPVKRSKKRARSTSGESESEESRRRDKKKRRISKRAIKKQIDYGDSDSDSEEKKKASRRKPKKKAIIESEENFSEEKNESEDEEMEDSDEKNKGRKEKITIPGERKSDRARKVVNESVALTDKEFEKMLREEKKNKKKKDNSDSSEEEKPTKKKKKVIGKKGYWQDSDEKSGNESDHYWYCEVCKDGGDLLLCDTCPKSFHKGCLKIDGDLPDGDWSCPPCTGVDLPEPPEPEDESHDHYCKICRDGGDVLLCDHCPCVYHPMCLYPPLKDIPDGDWKCPRCVTLESPLKGKIQKILTWRWSHQNREEFDHTHSPTKKTPDIIIGEEEEEDNNRQRKATREFFVRFQYYSYWDSEWISELSLEVFSRHHYLSFHNKWDIHEPPALEDGSTYGKPRHKKDLKDDPFKLEERFYMYGIKPEWLKIHRVIRHEGSGDYAKYLVKWRDLGYEDCTWEELGDVDEGLKEDLKKHIELYWNRRKDRVEKKKDKKEKKLKKSLLKQQLEKQPKYIDALGGKLHPYQLEGLNWLRFSWAQDTNTILADEMGLGKTIQAVSFIYNLIKEGHSKGPFLVSVPLSTVPNWEREFEFWAPDLYVLTYVGGKEARAVIREHEFSYKEGAFASFKKPMKFRLNEPPKFDVLLTSYEFVNVDTTTLSSIHWSMLIVDEAHRLKSNQSLFFRTLFGYKLDYKLLLTGTPLQNNLEELFHLLNFLEPGQFNDMEDFLNNFSEVSKEQQVRKLHEMLAPHMLRRLKSDVLKDIPDKSEFIVRVELTAMQKKFYKHILTKNYEALNVKGASNTTSLMNLMMDLRKCCNHPYLFPTAEQDAPLTDQGYYEGTASIKACGKLDLMQKMLVKLNRDGHRVLIFSQMTRVLDIIEDFLHHLQLGFERIDGAISGSQRQMSIDRFNSEESKSFVFLLSTKAGGLGINLATADTVIIYDMDWNPHNDIQAFSRAHRIGQKNKVMIYRFVSKDTVEEKIAQVCKQKMMLTELVIHRGMNSVEKTDSMSKQEVNDILKFGADNLFKDDVEGRVVYDDAAVEKLLDREQMSESAEPNLDNKEAFGFNEYLKSFKVASYKVKEGTEEVEEEEEEEEEKKEEDPLYWQKVLGDSYSEHVVAQQREQEAIEKSLGKGKRLRRKVNYADNPQMETPKKKEVEEAPTKKKRVGEEETDHFLDDDEAKYFSDYVPSSDSDNEEEEEEEEEEAYSDPEEKLKDAMKDAIKNKTKEKSDKKGNKNSKKDELPPLLSRNKNGHLEVLGFTARHRRAFLDAVMRFGLPQEDTYHSQWLVRDLRRKSEKVFRVYTSLFMRHLCEPLGDTTDRFSDGVPVEGLSPPHVLARIGMIQLIRKKVLEFEQKHGTSSMIVYAEKDPALMLTAANSKTAKELKALRKDAGLKEEIDEDKEEKSEKQEEGNESKDKTVTDEVKADEIKEEKQGEKSPEKKVDKEDTPSTEDIEKEKEKEEKVEGDDKKEDSDESKTDETKKEIVTGENGKNEEKNEKEDETEEKMETDEKDIDQKASSETEENSKTETSGKEKMETEEQDKTEKDGKEKMETEEEEKMDTDKEEKMEVEDTGLEKEKSSGKEHDSDTGKDGSEKIEEKKETEDRSENGDKKDAPKDGESDSKTDDKSTEEKVEPKKEEKEAEAEEKSEGEKLKKEENNGESDEKTEKKSEKVKPKEEIKKEATEASPKITPKKSKYVDARVRSQELRSKFYIADGGFTELHGLWRIEEMQLEDDDKEYLNWHQVHDFWLLAGVITHGYRHWHDILSDPRFEILSKAFLKAPEKWKRPGFLNRRFQLLEQALVVEEQLKKATMLDPKYSTPKSGGDEYTQIDSIANDLRLLARGGQKAASNASPVLQKLLITIENMIGDIRSFSFSGLPSTLTVYTPTKHVVKTLTPTSAGKTKQITQIVLNTSSKAAPKVITLD